MLIAAFIIASLFPPYTQPVISTQLVPGIVSGQCVAAGTGIYLIGVACGGGGGGSNFPTGITTGVPGTDGPFAIVSSVSGPVSFTTNSTMAAGPAGSSVAGTDLLVTDSTNGPILALDLTGDLGLADSIAVPLVLANTYEDITNDLATLSLGRVGAPSGSCTPGSIYTSATGGTLTTTLYVCVLGLWHAVTIP
jgi:hypothetical protein